MMKIKRILSSLLLIMGLYTVGFSQDISKLEKQLKTEKSSARLADINNLLAQAYLPKDGNKAIAYAKAAIKYATETKNNNVKAEALNFQAKATAGVYAPSSRVPNRNNQSARQYHEAKNLYEKSKKLAQSIGYTQLELDNIENLAYLNTKKIGRHSPDKREELKYYKEYITRLKEIKKVTKPKATYTTNSENTGSNSTSDKPVSPNPSPASNTGKDKIIAKIKEERTALKTHVSSLKKEVTTLKTQLTDVNAKLKKALDSGTSTEEIERLKEEQRKIEADLKRKSRKNRKELEKTKKQYEEKLDETELRAKLAETRAERTTQGLLLGGVIAALVLSFLYFGYRTQRRARKKLAEKNEEIEKEKERSDGLLLNILPDDIAHELKATGAAKARRHENVTVLFSDFKNFTTVSEVLSPEDLVKELDYLFKGFDYIIAQYPSIEKIKTIGDAYMCCAGLLGEHSTATADIVKAAMDMQEFLFDYKAERQSMSLPYFEARIGLHTGPVVSGVVGNTKFAYDIWGDTVNVASRMESNGDVGKVNISTDTYDKIRYQFSCHPRGKIQVKNKGLIEMYFVDKVY